MSEERKHAVLFAATILAARKLNDIGNTPWANECAIKDAIEKAARILEKIDEKWPWNAVIGREVPHFDNASSSCHPLKSSPRKNSYSFVVSAHDHEG